MSDIINSLYCWYDMTRSSCLLIPAWTTLIWFSNSLNVSSLAAFSLISYRSYFSFSYFRMLLSFTNSWTFFLSYSSSLLLSCRAIYLLCSRSLIWFVTAIRVLFFSSVRYISFFWSMNSCKGWLRSPRFLADIKFLCLANYMAAAIKLRFLAL